MTRRRGQGGRADRARRPGARRLRRARGHLAAGRSAARRAAPRARWAARRNRGEPGQLRCPHRKGAPAWASELALAYESGAHGQFILYGNVHDRMAVGGRLVNLAGYLENELLAGFQVVLSYDLGNGLTIERGGELVEKWGGAELEGAAARAAAGDSVHQPLPALSRQPARARPRGAGERRGHPARRRPHRARRRRRLRARQPHQRAARVGLRGAVLRPALHQHPDRRQPQRRRAAWSPTTRTPRAFACRCRMRRRSSARSRCSRRSSRRRSRADANLAQLAGGAGRRHGVGAREPGEDARPRRRRRSAPPI